MAPSFSMVKLNTSMAGEGFAYLPGETVSLDKETERRLVDSGQAEYVNANRTNRKTKRSASHAE